MRFRTSIFLLLLGLTTGGSVAGQEVQANLGNNYALLFAGDIYEHWDDLVNPVHDARTLGEELRAWYGYEVELVENPTQETMLAKIREYAERTYEENDHLLIFYAGHGKFDEIDGEGYIVSADSEIDDPTNLSYIPYSQFRTRINNIPSKHILLLLDACFGGTFDARTRGDDPYDDVTRAEFIARKLAFTTRRYITSGGKEYVPDGRPGHHSPFMRRLLEVLRTYGGEDRILTLGEIQPVLDYVDPLPIFGEFGDNEPGSDFLLVARNPGEAELPVDQVTVAATSTVAASPLPSEVVVEEQTPPPSLIVGEEPEQLTTTPADSSVAVERVDQAPISTPPIISTNEDERNTERPTDQGEARPEKEEAQFLQEDGPQVEEEDRPRDERALIDSTYVAATNTLVEHLSTLMSTIKETVPPDLRQSAPYLEAMSLEKRGMQLYGAGLFTKAALLFDEAKEKYAEAARTPAPKEKVSPALQASIDGFVAMLQTSLDNKDSGGMGALSYRDRDWTSFFASADSLNALIEPGPVQAATASATLIVEVTLTYLDALAHEQQETLRHLWMLQDAGDTWMLTKVNPQD